MKRGRQRLAMLLAVLMMFSMMPTAALAADEADLGAAEPEIIYYNLGSRDVPVGSDEQMLESGEIWDVFEADGSYTIELEGDAFFPYQIRFKSGDAVTDHWFMTPDDTFEFEGHTFRVHSESFDPTVITQIGVTVNGEYIPAFPEEKEFKARASGSLNSMMPLSEGFNNINLTNYFPDELKEIPIHVVASNAAVMDSSRLAAWAKFGYYNEDNKYVSENDDFQLIDSNAKFDFSDSRGRYSPACSVEVILGTADQLNLDNHRLFLNVNTSNPGKIFDFEAVKEDRTPLEIYRRDAFMSKTENGKNLQTIPVDRYAYTSGDKLYLSMRLSPVFSGVDVTVYEGYYETEADIPATATDITSQILDQADLTVGGGYLNDFGYKRGYVDMPEITAVIKRQGTTVSVQPMVLYFKEDGINISSYSTALYADSTGGSGRDRISYSSRWSWGSFRELTIYTQEGYPADGIYYYGGLRMNNPADLITIEYGIENVAKAVVGNYAKAEDIPDTAEDIKTKLFANASLDGGYAADYSNGVTFTIVDVKGGIHHFTLKTENYSAPPLSELPDAPTPLSEDTYFRIKGANPVDNSESYGFYDMPYDADSYYYNGYQTVFVLKRDQNQYVPVTAEKIIPKFWKGNNVKIFSAENEGESASEQTTEVTVRSFESGKAVQYSAAAENDTNLKNYWVTFLTQQSGPKLFVNATNDETRYTEVTDPVTGNTESIPEREVFLTDDYGNHHDVFFANIGDEDITGLYVRLEDAENVALDEYWTIGATTTLKAFTTIERRDKNDNWISYGELANFAKVRLVPALDANGIPTSGAISGTLVIGYTGSSGNGEEVKIKLKGTAGAPKITTDTIVDGVKYVVYSSMIQTNNMYGSDAIRFAVSGGALPPGLSLKANGEIYGVPTAVGTFSFTVTAINNTDASLSDSKDFTITIIDNTDANVLATNTGAQGYNFKQMLTRNIDLNTYDSSVETFWSEGPFMDFIAIYLDSKLLVPGVDYTSYDGSWGANITAQTLRNVGPGVHTLSAEFRQGGDADAIMKRTSQNVEVTGVSQGSGQSSLPVRKPTTTARPTQPVNYTITAGTSVGGSISVAPQATAGTSVTVNATPEIGYYVSSVRAGDVAATKNGDSSYSFTMPASNITVTAVFERIQPDPLTGLPFIDVQYDDWFYPYVKDVYDKGIMQGTREFTFEPGIPTSRGMLVTVLYRLEGEPEVTTASPFDDVTGGKYYEKAVIWAAANGIVNGVSDARYAPDSVLTREQISAILYRYAKYKGYEMVEGADLSAYSDSYKTSEYALESMAWANAEGLIIGHSRTSLDPTGPATRAQLAAVLARFITKEFKTAD